MIIPPKQKCVSETEDGAQGVRRDWYVCAKEVAKKMAQLF